jgi:hypothetical protein
MRGMIFWLLVTVTVFVVAGLFVSAIELSAAVDRGVRASAESSSPWAPALEPVTMFLGGIGLMGWGWVVCRQRAFRTSQPFASQVVVQDRAFRSSGP